MEEYNALINILKEELVPAMGCTEPIALAYCASLCAKVLDEEVIQVKACVSGNIIKNVKSVIVPNTGGLKGIEASIAAGICAGDSDLVLEVISKVDEQGRTRMREFLKRDCIEVTPFKTREALDIKIECIGEHHCSTVRISQSHTHVVLIERDGSILFEDHTKEKKKKSDHSILSVEKIVEFANEVKIEDVKEVLERQIRYNMRIAEEGLKNSYGANVGKLLLDIYGDDVKIKARAYAAAGSDARMSGCEMPVIINSGSGNQGMTASLPVIIYAKEMKASEELLYRSLVVSNLITIHLKSGIGRLSAYCGAVSAGCGAGCGIAYLNGGNYELIAHTLVNAIAIASGIVCDGAKPSCASKIAVAVDAGIIGYYMAIKGQEFKDGEGLVIKGVENTIRNISRLSSKGMKKTDQEIIDMMCKC
ncbi:serine dehydratase subunit alpha family protein [Traorella massiliensis]|uniref:L-cysteine desulfidase family protein n=1 Tax=Traorella massiliensis TaxID=1903263 RepID=UPI003B5B0A24